MNNRLIQCLTRLLVAGGVLSGVPAWSESASSEPDGKDSAKKCVYDAAKSTDVRFTAYLVDQSALDYVKKWKKGIANYSILQDYYSNTTTVVKLQSFVLLWGNRWIKIDTPDENRNALMYFKNATAQPTMVMAKATMTEKGLVNVSVVADLNYQVLRRTTFHERYPHALQRGPELVPATINLRLHGFKMEPFQHQKRHR